jgi:predicted dehydrogenase
MVDKEINRIGFLGAGGIARAHAYALQAMKFYYEEAPEIELVSVCSARQESGRAFAAKFGFEKSESFTDFTGNGSIDTVFIMGPNNTHFEHFRAATEMTSVKRIYLEKPVCSNETEEMEMKRLLRGKRQTGTGGFSVPADPGCQRSTCLLEFGHPGKTFHFDLKYYHGDYLHKSYRDKRKTRLTPAPDGGAMADLGSHGISLLTAFLGNRPANGACHAGRAVSKKFPKDLTCSVQ